MTDGLKTVYREVVRAACMTYEMNAVDMVGPTAVEQHIPVIPGVFPGESVTLSYRLEGQPSSRMVRVSAPVPRMPYRMEVGPFRAPSGETIKVPKEMKELLDVFAETGPERLMGRFRDLLAELVTAGVTAGQLHGEVDLAVVKSVMGG